MKVTKGQLNEEIRRILSGGDISVDLDVHKVDVDVIMTYVGLDLIKKSLLNEASTRENGGVLTVTGSYLVNFNDEPVLTDSDGRKYAVLPAKVVQLPGDRGVYMVTLKGGEVAMANVDPLFKTMYHGLEALDHSRISRYNVEGDKVYFHDLDKSVCEVDMKLVCIPKNDDDMMNVPSGYQAELFNLVFSIFATMRAQMEDAEMDMTDGAVNAG